MLIKEIIGREAEMDLGGVTLDELRLEWYELNKRVQRKVTEGGRDVALKFISEGVALSDGDLLYRSDEEAFAIVVRVLPTEAIVLSPVDMLEMATICYEIGNKHMPLFIDGEQLLLPFEAPMFKWLQAAGYSPRVEARTLVGRLRSKSGDHHHSHSHDGSLLSKVMHLAGKTH